MNAPIKKCLMILTLTASLVTAASVATIYSASAYAQHGRYVCRWVPAHWRHGHWVPARRVCGWRTLNRNCRWVPGHTRQGRWIPGHRICW